MLYQGYDREGLDAQYFMRARHPEWEDYFNKWEAWGARVRKERDGRLDVAFGESPDETVDIFPAAQPNAPIHVFIHGGYWQAMSKTDFSYVADGFVDAGASLVIVNYTLAPDADIDEIGARLDVAKQRRRGGSQSDLRFRALRRRAPHRDDDGNRLACVR